MALWNTTGTKPQNLTRAEKRNVIATDNGWVRRNATYTDVHSNVRVKEELLVPIAGLANSTNMGSPTITDVWYGADTYVVNTTVTAYVAFDEPISSKGLAGNVKLTIANTTASGSSRTLTANTKSITNANNVLTFTGTITSAGTYKIQAQTIANSTLTAANTRSLNTGTEAVSWVISGAVSNTASTISVTAS